MAHNIEITSFPSSSSSSSSSSPPTSVVIENRTVTCPHCHENFPVKRKAGGGASYVNDWRKVPQKCLKILVVWISQTDMINTKFEKKDLRAKLADNGLHIKEDPFNARISELLGLGLVNTSINEKRIKDTHYTQKVPQYSLILHRACRLLNDGGRLR